MERQTRLSGSHTQQRRRDTPGSDRSCTRLHLEVRGKVRDAPRGRLGSLSEITQKGGDTVDETRRAARARFEVERDGSSELIEQLLRIPLEELTRAVILVRVVGIENGPEA